MNLMRPDIELGIKGANDSRATHAVLRILLDSFDDKTTVSILYNYNLFEDCKRIGLDSSDTPRRVIENSFIRIYLYFAQ